MTGEEGWHIDLVVEVDDAGIGLGDGEVQELVGDALDFGKWGLVEAAFDIGPCGDGLAGEGMGRWDIADGSGHVDGRGDGVVEGPKERAVATWSFVGEGFVDVAEFVLLRVSLRPWYSAQMEWPRELKVLTVVVPRTSLRASSAMDLLKQTRRAADRRVESMSLRVDVLPQPARATSMRLEVEVATADRIASCSGVGLWVMSVESAGEVASRTVARRAAGHRNQG